MPCEIEGEDENDESKTFQQTGHFCPAHSLAAGQARRKNHANAVEICLAHISLKSLCPSVRRCKHKNQTIMALSVKLPFAGLFRRFFGPAEITLAAAANAAAAASPMANPFPPAPAVARSAAKALPSTHHLPVSENEIEIPLATVVSGLPLELRAKIMSAPSARATIRLQAEKILSQLSTGTVKISFGELRQLAPGLIANSGGEHDSRTVNLPLQEILARINPALLARRPVKTISVADDIAGPFADRGHGINFTSHPLKATAAPPTAGAILESVGRVSPRADVSQDVLAAREDARPTTSNIHTSLPAAPSQNNFEAPPLEASAPIAFTPRAIMPAPSVPLENSRFTAPVGNDTNHFTAHQPVRTVPNAMLVSLASLAENWPVELKNELSQPPFVNANVSLPAEIIEAGLKRGRVTMTWKQIRTLVAVNSPASANDARELQLPLKIVAPLFLAAKKNNFPAQTKVMVKSEIPDLFFGFPQPAAAPAIPGLPTLPKPQPNSQDTNYFTPGVQSQAVATEVHAEVSLQTDFSSRQATPKEVVARARALPGVAGAVVALPDGLRVASEVPTELNADTLAAFLPQIFERVNQSTRELRLGALNNVSFTVGDVPWKIFRVNSVYFAAFGRAGESLPSAQLVQLASQIDRKK